MSAQKLADQLVKVGIKWDRSIVANFESTRGRRANLSVEELLALAYVLDVSPIHLMIPTDPEVDFLAITPELAIRVGEARDWIRGIEAAPGQDPNPFFREAPDDEVTSTPAEIAAESARIQYHRKNGHLLREGKVDAGDYFRRAGAAEDKARAAVEQQGDGDGR